MAWMCMAWHGMAWHGMAWHGMAWHGMAWQGATQARTTHVSMHPSEKGAVESETISAQT